MFYVGESCFDMFIYQSNDKFSLATIFTYMPTCNARLICIWPQRTNIYGKHGINVLAFRSQNLNILGNQFKMIVTSNWIDPIFPKKTVYLPIKQSLSKRYRLSIVEKHAEYNFCSRQFLYSKLVIVLSIQLGFASNSVNKTISQTVSSVQLQRN